MNERKRSWIIGGAILVVAVVLAFFLWPRSLEYHARRILNAVVNFDAQTIWQYVPPHEAQKAQLTEAKYATVFDSLIKPRFAGLHAGAIQSNTNGDHQAAADTMLSDGKGFSYPIAVVCWAGDDGGESLVMNFLIQAWQLDYARKLGRNSLDGNDILMAWSEGVKADKARLNELGVTGIVAEDPDVPFRTWDQIERWCDETLAAAE